MKNGRVTVRTGGDSDWHGLSRLSPVCTQKIVALLWLGPVVPRSVPV